MVGKRNEDDRSRTRRCRRYFVGLVAGFIAVSTIIIAGPAGAQVEDGEFDVQVVVDNGSGGTAERSDFAFQVDGGPAINWPVTGVIALILDASVPHTVTPVPFSLDPPIRLP